MCFLMTSMRKCDEGKELCAEVSQRQAQVMLAEQDPSFGAFFNEAIHLKDVQEDGVWLRKKTPQEAEYVEPTKPIALSPLRSACCHSVNQKDRISLEVRVL
jgi:hypothetical protein